MTTINRRDFLKLAGTIGVGAVLGTYKSEIADVFAQAADKGVKLVWLQGQGCTGCTVSLIQGTHPDLYDAILKLQVDIPFHPTIMAAAGKPAIDALEAVNPDILVIEGAVPNAEYCEVGGKPFVDVVKTMAAKSGVVVAVGTCAAFGGIPAAKGNPTNARSVSKVLGKTVVNIPGCPAHPDWILLVAASVILGIIPELDDKGRPVAFFGEEIHENCARRGYYDKGDFAEDFTESDMSYEKCLWKVGCKAPVTRADCAVRKWNNGVNVCMNAGAPCIGCADPGFPDSVSPLYVELEKVPTFVGIDTDTAGKVAIGATAVGIAAHAIRRGIKKHPESKEE
ncbi:MAG: hydrogenase small subunit [Methanobacteriota archaeon]